MDEPTMKEVVFVLGGPGSGKGTHVMQCATIASELGYTHLSTGDLLREEQAKGSELATEIAACIRDGLLVPSSIIVTLLKGAILAGGGRDDGAKRFLIDGFPRSRDNLNAWFGCFADDEIQVSFVLYLDCPKEALTERLLERGKTSGRADDNPDSVLKRFDTFERESLPVVADMDKLGMVRRVCTVPAQAVVSHQIRRIFAGSRLVRPMTRTFALIKPDAVSAGKTDDIIQRARDDGFVVVARVDGVTWPREQAEDFYSEHKEKPFYDSLVEYMTSGSVVQLCLEKEDAVTAWRRLAGPTNSTEAKESAPSSLRALYGTDGTKNAVHGSDSLASAFWEINFCLGADRNPAQGVRGQQEEGEAAGPAVRSDFVPEEKVFALLQPGTSELHKDDILRILAFRGFKVLKTTTQILHERDAREIFVEEAKETWFQDLSKFLTEGGETTALCLSRVAAVDAFQALMGPADPAEAKERFPSSLRAMFGKDRMRNAVYGSSSSQNAARDLKYWFQELSSERLSEGSVERTSVGPGNPTYDEMMSYVKQKVDPIVNPLLRRVLKVRPEDIVTFIAEEILPVKCL